MTKWILPFLLLLCFANTSAAQPRPLPDDQYPQDPYPGDPPRGVEVPYSLGSGDSERFSAKTSDFYPRSDLSRLVRLRLTGLTNTIEVKEVRIVYADYNEERTEPSLEGELKPGQMRVIIMRGRPIYRIEVTATSSYLWKKPGGYQVDVSALR